MWIEFLKSVSDACDFFEPANEAKIQSAEGALEISFHQDLRSLLLESDGVFGEYGLGLIWSVERIHADNLNFRTNEDFKEIYMPFDSLLFFGDGGNGDQFAYPIQNGMIRNNDVFVWNHEDDSRNRISPNLKAYLEGWLNGEIQI